MPKPIGTRGSVKSGVYLGTVTHVRKAIKPYRFANRVPWWLINLDELAQLDKLWGFAHNRFSLFNFRDLDHIHMGEFSAKDNIIKWARTQGLNEEIIQVSLLTNLRTLGYVFNPVSFYYLQGKQQRWIISEIGNTFWEQKPTLLGPFKNDEFSCEIPKLFYISPFLSLDNTLQLKLNWPSDEIKILINDISPQGELELTAVFRGERQEITQLLIFKLAFQFPLLCFQIITLIHWHAFKLWLKGIPYFKKSDRLDLQQGVFQWKSRKFKKQS